MAWVAVGIGGVTLATSLFSGIEGGKAAAKEADRKRKAEMYAATTQYKMKESNTNLQKAVLREQTLNAQVEVLRAGAEQNREVKKKIQKAASTLQASSEGLTSGRSGGRQMMVLQQKGAQAIHDSKTQASNQIAQMVENKDKLNNKLNADLMSSYAQMVGVLSTPGQIYQQNVAALVGGAVSAGAQGASMGTSLQKSTVGASIGSTQATGATVASSGEFGPGTDWDFYS